MNTRTRPSLNPARRAEAFAFVAAARGVAAPPPGASNADIIAAFSAPGAEPWPSPFNQYMGTGSPADQVADLVDAIIELRPDDDARRRALGFGPW